MIEEHQPSAKKFMPPPSEVKRWFEDALGRDDPKPSNETYDKLAREIQIIANRYNNTFIEREHLSNGLDFPILPTGMADVSPIEWEEKKLESVAARAGQVLSAIDDLRQSLDRVESFSGDYQWNSALNITDFREAILGFVPWLYGVGGNAAAWKQQQIAQRGRPKTSWHDLGRKVGALIQDQLRDAGYSKKLSLKNESSVAVIISTAAVNWIFDSQVQPSGFATAMRVRTRTETR